MEERESFVRFVGDADTFYQMLSATDELSLLWEQLLHIASNNRVDDEIIFDFPIEDRLLKIIYGPPFTIVFDSLLNGDLVVYTIHRPAF